MNLKGGRVFVLLLFMTGFSIFWRASNMLLYLESNSAKRDCSCEKCVTDEHSWFMQRFQRSVSPFLTGKYNLSEEDFNWWRKIQFERHDLNVFRKIMRKIFEMFPSNPPVAEPSADGCRTCAVVGNSGNLRRSHYGELIDQHDSVFRINYGKTEGYEEDVGAKTTHHVMYPQTAMDLDNSTHLVFIAFKILDLEWLVGAFKTGIKGWPIKVTISANKNLVMVVNPAFIKYVHESWLLKQGQYPSTGFMTVVLTLHICDEVSVFGFGADSDGNWNHYWEDLKDKNLGTGPHPGSVEYDMIMELAKQGKVSFYRGW